MQMRCDLGNLLRNAAELIPEDADDGAYAFMLGEVAGHIEQVRDGSATLDEFADLYMLRPRAQAKAA